MNETTIMLIWGIALLSISWTAIRTFKESNDESAIIKVVALVLTIAFAPLLALLQGVWAIKSRTNMEEKNVKTGFWSEYFKSLCNHPFRTVVVTALVVDGAVRFWT